MVATEVQRYAALQQALYLILIIESTGMCIKSRSFEKKVAERMFVSSSGICGLVFIFVDLGDRLRMSLS